MVLLARQRRILKEIENAIQGSDPRLTSLFAIFSLLSRDEEMPKVEQLRARASLLLAILRRELAAAARRLRTRPLARRRAAALFYPLAVMALASTLVMVAALPGASQCAAAAAGAARHSVNVRTCKSTVVSPVFHAR